MEVYPENIIGKWQREGTNAVYRFYKSGSLIIQDQGKQVALEYEIFTKERKSALIIDHKKFPFIIMNPGVKVPYFTVSTKSGMVTFLRVKHEEIER